MILYDNRFTTISLETLKTLSDIIDFPVCLCGGWAVYFTINEIFKQKKKRDYIGSQDIDIGFFLSPMMTKSELESTTLFKTVDLLESHGFQPEGFRYKKEIQINDQKTSKHHQTLDLFILYVDILVNSYPPSLYDLHPNCFFEVPLIEKIYQDEKNQVQIPLISDDLFIPSRPLLTAMNQNQELRNLRDLSRGKQPLINWTWEHNTYKWIRYTIIIRSERWCFFWYRNIGQCILFQFQRGSRSIS